jgi:hypothetical protein
MKKPNQYRILPNAKNIETSQFEFVALMASMSVVALAIDALLPALDIGGDYWDYRSRG